MTLVANGSSLPADAGNGAASPALFAPETNRRRAYLDWLRGIAVCIMIEAHVLDAWTRTADKAQTLYGKAMIVAGFGAPIFLFLAGVALTLAAGARLRRGMSHDAAAAQARRRGWQIFGLAFVFRLQSWIISGGPISSLLKVDILNVMGMSMLAAAVVWGSFRSVRAKACGFAALTVMCAMLTPLVRATPLFAPLPDRLEGYLRPVNGLTTFSIFPWSGFLLAGAIVGLVLGRATTARDERRTHFALTAAGVALAVGGYAAAFLPPIYPDTHFWTSSPTFFFLRVGILLLALPVARLWTQAWRGWSPMEEFGRASLFVYWIHVEMVYGVVSMPLHRQLTLPQAFLALAVFTAVLFVLSQMVQRVSRRGGGPSYLRILMPPALRTGS